MAEMTQVDIDEFKLITELLERLRETGVWLPQPSYSPGHQIAFDFYPYDLPEGAWLLNDEQRSRMVIERFKAAARAIGGRWHKNDPKESSYDDMYYVFTHDVRIGPRGVKLILRMQRDLICERVQVGTEKVTIPAQEARPERVEERPIYVRECKPLFARAEAELDAAMREIESGEPIEAELVE